MQVLFALPVWDAPSEVFLRRQMRMLATAGALGVIVTNDAGNTRLWEDQVPVISLWHKTPLARRLVQTGQRRLGLPIRFPTRAAAFQQVLDRLEAQGLVTDTILCHYASYAVELQPALEQAPQAVYIHVHGFDALPQLFPPTYPNELIRLAARATFICASQEVRGRLLRLGIAPDRIVVKPLGVEVPAAPPHHPASSEITILFLGRLVDVKGPDLTLRAFELACDQGLQGKLIIAGDGPLRATCEQIRAWSRWRDRIELLPTFGRDTAVQLYQQADVFTIHSIQSPVDGDVEAFGVALVEAMAAALPVVGSRIGGPAEIVRDGKTGILVEPGDVEAQAQAFLRLAHDPDLRQQMGRAGWQRAYDVFSYEREQRALLDILSKGVH